MPDCLVDAAHAADALPLYAVAPAGMEAFLASLEPAQAAFLRGSGFTAKAQQILLMPGPMGVAGAVLGLGAEPPTPWSFGALPFALPEGSLWHLAGAETEMSGQKILGLLTLGWCLGAYRYLRYRSPARLPARLRRPEGEAAKQAEIEAEALCLARDLVNTPAADLGPAELADAVVALAGRHGAECEIVQGDALQSGFPAVAAVGGGSPRAPRVAILRWAATSGTAGSVTAGDAVGGGSTGGNSVSELSAAGQGAAELPLVALCGKGVCFDTGGLDLKPAAGMLRMKKDMGGAAAMLALAEIIMRRHLPVRLLLVVGAVENAISATAMRPMDVLRTRAGVTVEVGNTDAEGRLVLADLLAYAGEQQPSWVVDAATLTGAARVALGPDLPALFCTEDYFADTILKAGVTCSDAVWRMPLHDGYSSWLDSSIAEFNNVASRPMAGAITAALFLRRFVPPGVRWAHLDLYAWNDTTRPGRPEGGEAQAVRALASGIAALVGQPA